MSTLEITSDVENKLLGRRELKGTFRAANGFLTRQGAGEAIASKLGVSKENIVVVSLRGKFGVRDVKAEAYVFPKATDAKSQLPKYLMIRQLSKEDRKKAKEDKKKAAQAAPAAKPAKA
ncbi:MAG: eS24 family ribosomal protein [Nitrososphaerales archaeon]